MAVSFITSTFMMWGWYAWQPYFLSLYGNPDAVWVAGIISAVIAGGMAVGGYVVPRLLKYFGKRTRFLTIVFCHSGHTDFRCWSGTGILGHSQSLCGLHSFYGYGGPGETDIYSQFGPFGSKSYSHILRCIDRFSWGCGRSAYPWLGGRQNGCALRLSVIQYHSTCSLSCTLCSWPSKGRN